MSNLDSPTSNEDIQKTLRKLNSCITLTTASSAVAKEAPNSSEDEEESGEDSRSSEESGEEADSHSNIGSTFIKDFSKRCISISVAKKDNKQDNQSVENEETETSSKNSHEASHRSDVNAFTCSFCQTGFKSQSELVRHILTCKRLSGSISFASSAKKSVSSDSEEESSEEESEADRSVLALQGKSSITATVSGSKSNLSNLKLSNSSLSAIGNLPKGISISTSCSITPKSIGQSEAKSKSSVKSEEDSLADPLPQQYNNKSVYANKAVQLKGKTELSTGIASPAAKQLIISRRESFEFVGFDKNSDESKPDRVIKRRNSIGRKSTATPPKRSPDRPCVPCNIEDIGSLADFHRHHSNHIKKTTVVLRRISSAEYSNPSEENSGDESVDIDQNNLLQRKTSTETIPATADLDSNSVDESVVSPPSNKPDSGQLKLTFKISNIEKPGGNKKVKTISILNSESMQESQERPIAPHQPSAAESSNILFPETINNPIMPPGPSEKALLTESPFPADPNPAFGNATPAEAPTSSYEPQFESFTGDWLNEYESGERIAAAMTGAVPPAQNNAIMQAQHRPITGGMYDVNQPLPPPGSNPQGSFEQLCLNDSYNQNQPNSAINGVQNHHVPYNNTQGDPFSDLNYLGNAERQVNSIGQQNEYMNGSNPSTPNSIGSHPSPGDSFRSLAASPQGTTSTNSPMSDAMSPTSPFPRHDSPLNTGMLPNTGSGPTPPLSMTQDSVTEVTAPRLTIANNLMATTTASLTPLMGVYNQQQWPETNSSSPNYSQSYIPNSLGPPGTIRPAIPGLPVGYRPSPRPRVRGRPPLMEGINRSMMRGPGRPPGPNSLNGRGGISARGSPIMYGSGSRMCAPQKRPLPSSPNHSPSKSMRREDINVPSRQKDTDCQIIAVANRNEGMPVISNVQGNSREERARPSSSSVLDSTIHLSDSITLSVRPNGGKDTAKASKGGDAGVVANLLASRGITVTPAAGEKETVVSSREERRLPSASDLNLSSAISVHPPSRDRDGFAVPQPPQSRLVVNDSADRPSRPPTVDLTQELSQHGAQSTRLQCSQCNRSFPTSSLLADHAKVHQTQQQSRMPYKCHLCNAGFSAQKGQHTHYQQFHQLQLSASDLAIPIVDVRNPVTQRKMQQLGVRAFLPLTNLQNRGASGVVGIPILTLENINNGQMSLQQWGITDVMSLGPPKTFNTPGLPSSPTQPLAQPRMRPPVPRSQ